MQGTLVSMAKVLDVTITASPEVTAGLAAQFALLADPLRLQIVQALAREELCTCHLMDVTGAKQTTISHHLRLLRESGFIVGEAEGRFTWYRLAPGAFAQTLQSLQGLASGEQAPRLRPVCAP